MKRDNSINNEANEPKHKEKLETKKDGNNSTPKRRNNQKVTFNYETANNF